MAEASGARPGGRTRGVDMGAGETMAILRGVASHCRLAISLFRHHHVSNPSNHRRHCPSQLRHVETVGKINCKIYLCCDIRIARSDGSAQSS